MGVDIPVKCRKCRAELFVYPQVTLQDSHGSKIYDENAQLSSCSSEVFYIPEETKPEWLGEILDYKGWLKGKINCPNCSARIGSYNFVSGMKCACRSSVLPPIHLVKSKVDFPPRNIAVIPSALLQNSHKNLDVASVPIPNLSDVCIIGTSL